MKQLLARILGISTGLLNFFIPIFRAAIAGSLERLLPIALEIVAELATGSLTSSDKKFVAVDRLKQIALKEGITVSSSILNLAVEAAVSNLKASSK
jgi:hypothetical protein